jgi:small subunit ribosomal protein S2
VVLIVAPVTELISAEPGLLDRLVPQVDDLRDPKDRLNRLDGRLPGAWCGEYRPDNSHPYQPTVAFGREVGARPTDGKGARGMAVVTMRQLLEAGVHFGHQTRRWDPRMRRFIHGERSGIYIIDLQQTLDRIEGAYVFTRDMVARGGLVLFVGTKRQAQASVQSFAEKCGMPYVNQRWLGGMLTNFKTISKRVGKMQEYQRMRDSGEFEAMPKKEALMLSRELDKLERNLTGIKDMDRLPDAIFVVDTIREHIAVAEANKLGIPVIAVVDTDCNPDLVQHLIPGNDDAIRSSHLMCRIVADAVEEGRFVHNARSGDDGGPSLTDEEKAAEQARARDEAASEAVERDSRGEESEALVGEPVVDEAASEAVERDSRGEDSEALAGEPVVDETSGNLT